MLLRICCLLAAAVAGLPADMEEGFVRLFDGKSTAGWRLAQPDRADGEWLVEEGTLMPKGRPRELMTDAEYGDFDLRFEWKIAAGGNSGVLYRIEEGYHPPTSGPEYQLIDDERYQERNLPDRMTGAAYGIYPPEKNATRPAGEWNTGRIVVRGNHVEHWLNGERVLAYEMQSDDWRARVAKSKFAKSEQYGRARRGHIVLQDHGSGVWFRNLRLRELD